LMSHIGIGAAWDWIGRTRRVEILPPRTGERDSDWYRGTADAVAQNLGFIEELKAERVLILSGDHIYCMNYAEMVEFHREKRADLTIAMMYVPWEETRHYGIAQVDSEWRVIAWEEKPRQAKSNLASMGVYVFNAEFLYRALAVRTGHDFGKDVVPWAVQNARVFAFPFTGYWRDVGTLRSYFEANRDLLPHRRLIDPEKWGIQTNWEEPGRRGDRPPTRFGSNAKVRNSVVSPGCVIEGEVRNSILSPGVVVAAGAEVVDSVIMHDSRIGPGAKVQNAIVDKNVTIGPGCRIGQADQEGAAGNDSPNGTSGLVVIGKAASIPPDVILPGDCIVYPWVREQDVPGGEIPRGTIIRGPQDQEQP
ncbi:MAG: sugar phosphate nucleotidyltransferase, partial [candidate division KSB1 bacterium]|nr:sugar phosphate nucleotidyltransferase [candidate division KSB1 bacterium]